MYALFIDFSSQKLTDCNYVQGTAIIKMANREYQKKILLETEIKILQGETIGKEEIEKEVVGTDKNPPSKNDFR